VERHVLEKPDGIGDEEAGRDSECSRLLKADMAVDVRVMER
jgi:3-deoxy-D-manno-octulosonic acid (KDO) 8-phosphate synthase